MENKPITLAQEHQTAASLYGDKGSLIELFEAVRKVAPWADKMSENEIALVVRKAVAMGLDPLNAHEVQIWKDNRGAVSFQIGYPLQIEWVRHFHGEHTEPQYTRLEEAELRAEGLQKDDVAYRVSFLMKKDIAALQTLIQAGYNPDEARKMLEVTGVGVATLKEYNGEYFAPNGRSRSWKVQKRALTDAYRRKFGDPTRYEIEELRRLGGFDNLRPDDWTDGGGLAPGDARALAESKAEWREHNARMESDPQYRTATKAQNGVVVDALWGTADDQPAPSPAPTDQLPPHPWDAGQVLTEIGMLAAKLVSSDASAAAIESVPARRGVFIKSLESCFQGDATAKAQQRKTVTWWLFGTDEGSSKALTVAQIRAWRQTYTPDGKTLADYAAQEMAAVLTAALTAAGQTELPLADEPAPEETVEI